MQTFLPYADFKKSAKSLDYKRLNSQRREARQILNVLSYLQLNPNGKIGWMNHPAVKMWKGYEIALCEYYNCILEEWIKRGYSNNMQFLEINYSDLPIEYPWWLGNENFHRAMRSRLIEKFPEFYEPKFPGDKGFNDGKYLWPVNDTKKFRII